MACSLERISRSASLRKISIRIRGSHRRLSLSPRPLDSGPTVSGRARLAPGDRMGCRGSPAIRSGCSSHRPPAALSYSGFDRGGESAVLALEVRRHLGALAVLLVEAHLPALTVRIVGGCAMNWAREIGSHGADNQHYRLVFRAANMGQSGSATERGGDLGCGHTASASLVERIGALKRDCAQSSVSPHR